MFFPRNANQTRPVTEARVINNHADALTARLMANMEAQRNHDALVSQAASVLPTLRPRFQNLTTADIDNLLQ